MQLQHFFFLSPLYRRSARCWLFMIPLWIIAFSAIGQNTLQDIQFKNITRSEDLPNNNVNQIVTDNYGFIWLATSDRLCKYNTSGKMQVYKADDEAVDNGLKSSLISCIYPDSKNNLWIGTRYGGLSRFHIPTDPWSSFVNDSTDVTSISNAGVGTENDLNIFQKKSNTFTRYQHDISDERSLGAKAVPNILVDENGWLWLSTWAGGLNLLIEDPGDPSKSYFRHFTPTPNPYSQNIWTIYQDSKDRYWLGTNMGSLFEMDLPSIANNFIDLQDWESKFFKYITDDSDPYSIGNHIVLDIHQYTQDRLWFAVGNMWFGTHGGISQFSEYNNQIENCIFSEAQNKDVFPNTQNIYVELNNKVWLAANDIGLICYDQETKTQQYFDNLNFL